MLKDKEQIKLWLDSMKIENYTINEDFTVNVEGDVDLSYKNLTSIPVQFGIVKGHFSCRNNVLTSLQGSPQEVNDFYCNDNQLTTLQGCPKSVSGDFYCHKNKLNSLEGCPKSVGGGFYCHNNELTSLEGCPKSVPRYFICSSNKLTSLQGCPQSVNGDFNCSYNQLTSLQGSPEYMGGDFNCKNNQLTSLEGSPKTVRGDFYCNNNPIKNIDLNTFDTNFNGIFYHYGSIIEEFSDFYINDKLVLINKDIHNIKLYTKLNDIIENKTETINPINKNKL